MAKIKRTITNVPLAQHIFISLYAPISGTIGTVNYWLEFDEGREFTLRLLKNGTSVKSEAVESLGSELVTIDSEVDIEVTQDDLIQFQIYQPNSIGKSLDRVTINFEVI